MTTVEVLLLMLLVNGTIFGAFALAYFDIVEPMRKKIDALGQQIATTSQLANNGQPYYAGKIPLPKGILPDLDEMSDEAWNIGAYGDDDSTAEEVEAQMSELQMANREAQQEWKDLENLKHGKGRPLIYGGG